MNGIEVTLTPKCMLQLYSTGEVIFNYLGVLYKVKKHARGDIYMLYIQIKFIVMNIQKKLSKIL